MNTSITIERAVVTFDSEDGYVVYAQDINAAQASGNFLGGFTLTQATTDEGDLIPNTYEVSDGRDGETVEGAAAALRTFADFMDTFADDTPALAKHIEQAKADAGALEGVVVS